MTVIATDIVALADAKTFLNITGTDANRDSKLSDMISAASQMIVNRIGPVAGSPSISETHDGGNPSIVLRNNGPIQSVTTVTESWGPIVYTLTQVTLDSGSVANAYSYSVDLDSGIITRRIDGIATPFPSGVRNIHVTYVGGFGTVPPDITEAAYILVKHLWDTQRGPTRRPGQGPDETPMSGAGIYMLPRRVEQILSQYGVPGIA